MDIAEVRNLLSTYVAKTLQDDELARANRVPLKHEGFDNNFDPDEHEILVEQYETETNDIDHYLEEFRRELQVPYSSFKGHFNHVCKNMGIQIEEDSIFYNVCYREFLKHEIQILEELAKRVKGIYPPESIFERLKVNAKMTDVGELHTQKVKQWGSNSGKARHITKDPNFTKFKKEVLRLKEVNSVLSNAQIAKKANEVADLNKSNRSLEGYVADILKEEY